MTPLQIEILLWYHCRTNDYRDGDFSAAAVREAIDWFIGPDNMLTCSAAFGVNYRLTDRGQAFVDHIRSLPLPVCQWVMPSD